MDYYLLLSVLRILFLRYLTCRYTVTLKPELGVTQGHRKR